jgi:hypothetical protein
MNSAERTNVLALAEAKRRRSMNLFKLFSAGLIAVAMLTTSAMAHETSAAERYVAREHHAHAAPADHWLYSHARMPAPSAAESGLSPQGESGGVCDHGDDPQIC